MFSALPTVCTVDCAIETVLITLHYITNCTNFGKLILRKIIKIAATRCHILKLKCTEFDFGWSCGPDPAYLYLLVLVG